MKALDYVNNEKEAREISFNDLPIPNENKDVFRKSNN